MNDIEKAMTFLREERHARTASSSDAIASEADTRLESSLVDDERAVRADASIGRHARDDRVVVGSDVSITADATEASPALVQQHHLRSVAVARLRGVDGDGSTPTSSDPPTRRFDDALFEDDVLDGIGTGPLGVERGDSAVDSASSSGDREADVAGPSHTGSSPANDESPLPVDTVADVSRSDPEDRSSEAGPEDDTAQHEPERVVSLPLKRLAARGFLTPGAAKGRLSEEFRRVKRPILKNIADETATDGHRNVVMITSSVAGEGKTYTAINLAMSLAVERKRTVLLVDADVLKGSAGTVLGIDGDRPGLVDVLDDERLDVADVMLATDVPDLRFVPAGRRDEHTTELLSSPRMSELIDELARRYEDRIIVLDCPPMLQTNEANVIVDHAGQVVFVVAGEETDQRLVLEAMGRFDEDKSVGVLLNKASGNSAAYGYDYGYG